ncbi:hypothetical protein CI610_01176 [invertebrate metagenome]|uniref:Uncharacterized protein n=1 Tax=invertebrate metagenome TaxID=1711999 RepID=A0A2H9T9B0_9ZZZZ
MLSLSALLQKITVGPTEVQFDEIMDVITRYYSYRPVSFSNGVARDQLVNKKKENAEILQDFCVCPFA